MKHLVFGILIIGLMFFYSHKAYAEEVSPGMLPPNPFYFMKKFSRSLRRIFTPDPIKRAELELRILDQSALEVKKLSQIIDDEESITNAIENYEDNLNRLRLRLELLSNKNYNPETQSLLNKVAERRLAHEKILQASKTKYQGIEESFDPVIIPNQTGSGIGNDRGFDVKPKEQTETRESFGGVENIDIEPMR